MAVAELKATVRAQIIPVGGDDLVLPNAAVAEIVQYSPVTAVPDAPEWLLGLLSWREKTIALLSFELASRQDKPAANARAKIAVLNAPGGDPELHFFAILTQGVPRLMSVDESKIAPIEHETETDPLILSRVIVNGEPAIIPNLDVLERMLLVHKDQWLHR
jgi:chemosensory pili system protein ChpC